MSKILVVDNHEGVRKSLVALLKAAQYEVCEAADVEAGRALLAQDSAIDLVISDQAMPNEKGDSFLQAVRALGKPAILVSEGARPADLDPDIVFLERPYPPADLKGALQSLLTPSGAA